MLGGLVLPAVCDVHVTATRTARPTRGKKADKKDTQRWIVKKMKLEMLQILSTTGSFLAWDVGQTLALCVSWLVVELVCLLLVDAVYVTRLRCWRRACTPYRRHIAIMTTLGRYVSPRPRSSRRRVELSPGRRLASDSLGS